VIYETNVRGCTIHPVSGVAHPGTYRGLAEKLPYLKTLGVTAVELMPVQEFNENELAQVNPLTGERLLPHPPNGGDWYLALDTSCPAPQDLFETGEEVSLDDLEAYRVGPHSSVILVTRPRKYVQTGGQPIP